MSWHLLRIQGSHLLLLSNAPSSRSLVFELRYVQSSASWASDPGRGAPWWPQLASWGLCEQIPALDPLTGPVLITECWVKTGLNFSSAIFSAIWCTTQIFIHTVHTTQLCIKQSHYIHLLCFTQSFPVLITGKLSLISQNPAGEW